MNNQASGMSNNQCVYRVQQGQWGEISEFTADMSKLSLIASDTYATQLEKVKRCLSNSQHVFEIQYSVSSEAQVWSIHGNYQALNELIQDALIHSDFDYLLWPEKHFQPPGLLVFDMDSTFIEIEVIDELAKRNGVGEKVAAVTEAAMRGELDFAESLIARVSCLKGLSEQAINEVADNLPVSKGVDTLVKFAKLAKCHVAIVSGGFLPFVNRLKHEMQLYQVHANQLASDGEVLTGELEGAIVDAQAKADFIRQLCQQLKLDLSQVMAIGDGANDLKMMELSGFNLAYRAKPKVQELARGRMNTGHLGQLVEVFNWR